MKTLAYKVGPRVQATWQEQLEVQLPQFRVLPWAIAKESPECVDYAAVWKPDTGTLARMTRLQGIVSIAAGADHLFSDAELPRHVPIVRTTGADLVTRMVEYVVLHVLRYHRGLDRTVAEQSSAKWKPFSEPPARQRRVGMLGYGNLGQACAQALEALGFSVCAWARSQRDNEGTIRIYCGDSERASFLERCDILVCLLPLTDQTRNILNTELFNTLPVGARLINVGRGEHLVDADLLSALDNGQLGAATLDVFREEPLPSTHPFWLHPDILVTPHIASLIDPIAGARLVAEHIQRFERSDDLTNVVNLDRGY